MRPRKTTLADRKDKKPVAARKLMESGGEKELGESETAKILREGVATEMWLELEAHPPKVKDNDPPVRSLWLRVKGAWLRYHEPNEKIERAVLSAFGEYSDRLEVRVWYLVDKTIIGNNLGKTDPPDAEKIYDTAIVGLVVHSK